MPYVVNTFGYPEMLLYVLRLSVVMVFIVKSMLSATAMHSSLSMRGGLSAQDMPKEF